jgi:hypothetical protein
MGSSSRVAYTSSGVGEEWGIEYNSFSALGKAWDYLAI